MSNTEIWDALCKSDPKQTKSFSRAGGFKGTALKPIWIVKRLTEQFGPCGLGWGIGKPEFQVVPSGDEMLVYCTVSAWHGSPEKVLWGVGGDKVTTKRQSGAFNDDEAFKKAFTDAVGNAFKFIGVGADIHMGQFDGSKYVQAMEREFSEPEPEKQTSGGMPDAEWSRMVKLAEASGTTSNELAKRYKVRNLKTLTMEQYTDALDFMNDRLAAKAKEETNNAGFGNLEDSEVPF